MQWRVESGESHIIELQPRIIIIIQFHPREWTMTQQSTSLRYKIVCSLLVQ
jgi:hypothetical protein